MVRAMWGYDCILNGNNTNSNGVAVLFKNNFDFRLHTVIRDDEGKYIILDIEMLGKRMTLVNLYAPSSGDHPEFFEKIEKDIDKIANNYILIGGDWNVVLNPALDSSRYRAVNRPRARKKVYDLMLKYDLIDSWRELYPEKKKYTWRRFKSFVQGRLDYFFLSQELNVQVKKANISPGYCSDHALVSLELKVNDIKRGKPLWKFNNSLLRDKEYAKLVKATILKVKQQYSLPQKGEMSSTRDTHHTGCQINVQLFFEMILLEIRGKTISYAAYKKKQARQKENKLRSEIKKLEDHHTINENDLVLLEAKKEELRLPRQQKIEGMIVRSKIKWIQEGKRPSKYFCHLEKRNFVQKHLSFIEKEDGEVLFDQDEIVKETKDFYEKLSESREKDVVDIDLHTMVEAPTLSSEEKESLEGLISEEEALTVLKRMNNQKSPGSDGFTTEFYKFFWKDIGHLLVRSINYGFRSGEMSITQKEGIITCIPKEDKPKRFLRNWRPITLLNTSYKIASSCIAARIKTVLPKIIHNDQKGFMKGRYIGENLRLLYDVLFYTNFYKKPGLLLAVDFEKAFDSVAWSFIKKSLDRFNFGPDIKRWV